MNFELGLFIVAQDGARLGEIVEPDVSREFEMEEEIDEDEEYEVPENTILYGANYLMDLDKRTLGVVIQYITKQEIENNQFGFYINETCFIEDRSGARMYAIVNEEVYEEVMDEYWDKLTGVDFFRVDMCDDGGNVCGVVMELADYEKYLLRY